MTEQERLMPLYTLTPNSSNALLTVDPNIRTLRDLAGKRVALDDPGNPRTQDWLKVLELAGVKDKIRVEHLQAGQIEEWLADSRADVGLAGISDGRLPTTPTLELAKKRRIYFIDGGYDLLAKSFKEVGYEFKPFPLHKGVLQRAMQIDYDPVREDVAYSIPTTYTHYVSPDAPEAVVYDLVKTLLNHVDDFQKHVPSQADLMKQRIGQAQIPQAAFHPGARKAYQELNMLYGLEGDEEFNRRELQPAPKS